MRYIDAHTHLNSDELYPTREHYLSDFIACGGIGLVNVGVDPVWNHRGVEIAQKSLSLYGQECIVKATVGGHPSEVSFGNVYNELTIETACAKIEEFLLRDAAHIVAVGECGMDAHYPGFTLETALLQQQFFRAQCLLARRYNLPVVIHSRDAFDLTLEVLQEFSDLSLYFHCWGYGVGEMEILIQKFPKLRFGFCGNSTYPKAVAIRESFLHVTTHAFYKEGALGIVLETDAPWLSPQGRRGKQHAPMYITEQYTFLAQLADQSVEKFTERVIADRSRLYSI